MQELGIVNIRDLMKTFDGREVISHCDMTVKQGMIYGFLGANGAGKTTILKMIMGLLTPTSGKITVAGKDMPGKRTEVLSKIGSIIEMPVFYEHLSAEENLNIHLSYMGASHADSKAALRKVGLEHTERQPVSKFSLGMKQRLGIARAIVHQPDILLLDEPLNGLDPVGIRQMRELLLSLAKEQNITIIISSHILNEIEHIADVVGVLVNGRVEKEVSMESIRLKYPNGLEDYFFKIMSGGSADE